MQNETLLNMILWSIETMTKYDEMLIYDCTTCNYYNEGWCSFWNYHTEEDHDYPCDCFMLRKDLEKYH
jgi:hypothetical protein